MLNSKARYLLVMALAGTLPLSAVAQSSDSSTYYYRNGVKHTLSIDPARRVDLALGTGTAPRIVAAAVASKSLAQTTELLRDNTTQALQALPGGILVTFKQAVTQEQALEALMAFGITSASPAIGTIVWHSPTPAGLPALALANRLHESGKFAAVEPNWWRQRRAK